jgi:hypothetical protein
MEAAKNDELISLKESLLRFWEVAREKVSLVEKEFDQSKGSPVFTVSGKYTSRGWTEWTQGFQYGIPLLIFEATNDQGMLNTGKRNTLREMGHHISHFGVHDHAFNNLSTYGNLLRLGNQGKIQCIESDLELYRLALKMSGAVQAKRWTKLTDGGGFIYSFNGPHSLFIDTIRTCRILIAAHILGHRMLDENDSGIDLLEKAIRHGITTAKYSVFYGNGRDFYDERGRVAHESVFNVNDGNYRCPNSQQGFSGFTTWTRGLSWAILGFSEFLEYLEEKNPDIENLDNIKTLFMEAACATSDFYIGHSASDGIPYWDTGAPGLYKLGEYQQFESDPFNEYEPVDSSAAAIVAQGLFRLSHLIEKDNPESALRYYHTAMKILQTLLSERYLCSDPEHHGILLHTIYHRPNGWDHIPAGSKIPCGESGMWGDYHLVELCLYVQSILEGKYYTFFNGIE